MSEPQDEQQELPLAGAGARLLAAREAAGISRAAIAARTRISERVIAQMEAGRFDALPSRTYAVGFARSYARTVGLDETMIVDMVRRELGYAPPADTSAVPSTEPGDPARVPTARFAWWLAFAALVLVAGGLYVWRTYWAPTMALPSLLPEELPTIEPTFTTDMVASGFPALDPNASFAPSDLPNPAFTYAPRPRPVARRSPAPSPDPLDLPAEIPSPPVATPTDKPSATSTVSN